MDLIEGLRTTAATRAFTQEDLPDSTLYEILDTARFAPNGGNRQSWQVIVIRDPATKRAIADLYDLGMREYLAFQRAGLVPFAAASAFDAQVGIDLDAARQVPLPEAPEYIAMAPVVLVLLVDSVNAPAVDSHLDRVSLTTGGSIFPFAHNILLAARAAGYGGHLTSVLARQEPALRELLDIPKEFLLGTMIPLGRPRRQVTRLRRRPVEEFTTVESFAGAPFSRPTD